MYNIIEQWFSNCAGNQKKKKKHVRGGTNRVYIFLGPFVGLLFKYFKIPNMGSNHYLIKFIRASRDTFSCFRVACTQKVCEHRFCSK